MSIVKYTCPTLYLKYVTLIQETFNTYILWFGSLLKLTESNYSEIKKAVSEFLLKQPDPDKFPEK